MTAYTTDIQSRPVFTLLDAVKTLRLWIDAAKSRRALRKMSYSQLADLGITPREADAEAARPFWDTARRS